MIIKVYCEICIKVCGIWNFFFFVPCKVWRGVKGEGRGRGDHEKMMHSMVSCRVSNCVSHSLSCMFTALLLSLMSKLKKCKNEHEEQEGKKNKNAHTLLVETTEKMSFFGRMEELFPLFFPLHFLNIVDSLLPLCVVAFFCYKRGLKKNKKEEVVGWALYSFSRVRGRGWGEVTPQSSAISNIIVHSAFVFCKPPSVFTCMSLSEKRVDRENKLLQSHSHVL